MITTNFGGDWTKIKIEILVQYAKAYLTIMKSRGHFSLMYFDGFAGSGFTKKAKKRMLKLLLEQQDGSLRFLIPYHLTVITSLKKIRKTLHYLKKTPKMHFRERLFTQFVKIATRN